MSEEGTKCGAIDDGGYAQDLVHESKVRRNSWLSGQVKGRRVLLIAHGGDLAALNLAQDDREVVGLPVEPFFEEYKSIGGSSDDDAVSDAAITLVNSEGFKYEYPQGSFDSVVLVEVLERIACPEALLEKIQSLLTLEGRLIISASFGVTDDPAQVHPYYFSDFLSVLRCSFKTEVFEIRDATISYVGIPGDPDDSLSLEDADSDLETLEQSFRRADGFKGQLSKARCGLLEEYESGIVLHEEKISRLNARVSELEDNKRVYERVMGARQQELEEDLEATKKALDTSTSNAENLREELGFSRTKANEFQGKYESERRWRRSGERTIENYRTSTRYILGDITIRALRPSMDTIKFPFRLARLVMRKARGGTRSEETKPAKKPNLWPGRIRRFKSELVFGSFREKVAYMKGAPKGVGKLSKAFLFRVAVPFLPRSLQVKWGGSTGEALLSSAQITEQNAKFQKDLFAYLARVAADSSSDKIVLMFSGTIYIQEKRANRPIRLTRVLIDKNISVLFSYFRWREDEVIPGNYDDRLFQSPIDKTMEFMRDILKFDFGDKEKIFVFSFPYPPACRFINEFNTHGWRTIYDARDDWEEFGKVGMAKWYDKPSEMYAVNNCDVTTCISQPLQRKLQAFTKEKTVRLCRNAYDTKFLKTGEIGESRAKGDEVVIGYFGHLTDRWFDWDFVIELAKAKPEWRIELIGHQNPRSLKLPENVKYLGFLDHTEICRIAGQWKCAIIPFKITKLAEGVDPIKIYEYLALGLGTVSLTMPQIAEYPYVHLAQTLDEFIKGVEELLKTKTDPELIRKWLSENTWEKRVDELLEMASSVNMDTALKRLCETTGNGR